jgi:tetratricopeptide (TPR) repeat protein
MLLTRAERFRSEGRLPKAAEAYARFLDSYPDSRFRHCVVVRLFDIANFWLDDTRELMELTKEWQASRGPMVWWSELTYDLFNFFHFEPEKPLVDEESEAVAIMEKIIRHDPRGRLTDQAYFLAGSVHFFNGDYPEADRVYSALLDALPHSPLAVKAAEVCLISKKLSPGDAASRRRIRGEMRELVQRIRRDYPEFAERKKDFLDRMSRTDDDLPRRRGD